MSRDIELLVPELRILCMAWDKIMKDEGIPHMITSTARWLDEQIALFCQHRLALEDVNRIREAVGLPPLSPVENTRTVTWTLKSKHVIKRTGELARAFDFAVIKDGKPVWDLKVSVDGDDIPDYDEAGVIGEKLGLKWGGRFKNSKGEPRPDRPHFELEK